MPRTLKAVAATLVVVGAFLGYLHLKYAPHTLLLESSPARPGWLGWVAWLVASLAAFLYIGVDIAEWWSRRKGTAPSSESAGQIETPAPQVQASEGGEDESG